MLLCVTRLVLLNSLHMLADLLLRVLEVLCQMLNLMVQPLVLLDLLPVLLRFIKQVSSLFPYLLQILSHLVRFGLVTLQRRYFLALLELILLEGLNLGPLGHYCLHKLLNVLLIGRIAEHVLLLAQQLIDFHPEKHLLLVLLRC